MFDRKNEFSKLCDELSIKMEKPVTFTANYISSVFTYTVGTETDTFVIQKGKMDEYLALRIEKAKLYLNPPNDIEEMANRQSDISIRASRLYDTSKNSKDVNVLKAMVMEYEQVKGNRKSRRKRKRK